jgi:hypothetical protein
VECSGLSGMARYVVSPAQHPTGLCLSDGWLFWLEGGSEQGSGRVMSHTLTPGGETMQFAAAPSGYFANSLFLYEVSKIAIKHLTFSMSSTLHYVDTYHYISHFHCFPFYPSFFPNNCNIPIVPFSVFQHLPNSI